MSVSSAIDLRSMFDEGMAEPSPTAPLCTCLRLRPRRDGFVVSPNEIADRTLHLHKVLGPGQIIQMDVGCTPHRDVQGHRAARTEVPVPMADRSAVTPGTMRTVPSSPGGADSPIWLPMVTPPNGAWRRKHMGAPPTGDRLVVAPGKKVIDPSSAIEAAATVSVLRGWQESPARGPRQSTASHTSRPRPGASRTPDSAEAEEREAAVRHVVCLDRDHPVGRTMMATFPRARPDSRWRMASGTSASG